jgi:hypothetical protein
MKYDFACILGVRDANCERGLHPFAHSKFLGMPSKHVGIAKKVPV